MILRVGAFAAAATLLAHSASAAPVKLPGFPLKLDGAVHQGATMIDFDRDGTPELVVEHAGKLSIYNADGKLLGQPIDLARTAKASGGQMVGPPAFGDLDGDGKPEIAFSWSLGDMGDGMLVALRHDGQPLWLQPIALVKGPGSGPTIADVNGDGQGDVVVGTRDGLLVAVNGKALPVAGFPVKLGAAVTSPIAFGTLARGTRPVLAVGCVDGKVFVINGNGQIPRGFPLETRFAVSGAPAFGDLDNDGENELVVASQDFKVYAVKPDGSALKGSSDPSASPTFPVSATYRIYGGPALGDLDHDGFLDVVVGAGDGKIYAWSFKGRLLPGFPLSAGTRLYTNVLVADSDRDGVDEVFAAGGDGNLYGFTGQGQPLDGFPLRVGGDVQAAPMLGDLAPDTSVELVVGTPSGEVHGFRLARKGEVPMSPLAWPAQGHDPQRQGRFGPNPARYKNVVVTPEKPKTGEALKLAYEFYDLDGDKEPQTLVRWTVDDVAQPDLDGKRQVPGERVKKGQTWRASVQSPEDFALFKDGPAATIVRSPVIAVGNTPPSALKIALTPGQARISSGLGVDVVQQATDVDGDQIRYRYRWIRDGAPAGDKPALAPGGLHKAERWKVVVTPTDGEADGPSAEAETVVLNSAPLAPEITLSPAAPTIENDIVVTIAKPATDPDGDQLAYRYAFWINGQRRAVPPDRALLPKGVARHGDTVKVEAWAIDDETEGAHAMAEVKLVNAPPAAPQIAIWPEKPKTDNALSCGLVAGARDPELDPLRYKVQWTRNGQPYGAPGLLVVPAADTKKGETWAVSFVANDGEVDGPAARAEVVVQNSAPGRARLEASTQTPAVDEAVKVSIAQPSVDPDGDSVRYEWTWSVDGKPFSPKDKSAMQLAPGEFKKGQRLVVEVTPVDSDGAKGPAASIEIRPRNTPPGAPQVALGPQAPTIESGLKATVTTPAPDRDSDQITYRYRWYRDGALLPELNDRTELTPGEAKHGESWRVVVRSFDGESEGGAGEASVVVGNTAPKPPQVAVGPAHPTVVTGLSCDVTKAAQDADGDVLVLEYRWFRDGQPFELAANAAKVPGEALRAGQTWRCEVLANDGQAQSSTVQAQATVENAAPSAPQAVVQPAVARAGEPLVCAVAGEGKDPDGDRLSYDLRWVAPAGMALPALEVATRVPGSLVKKGQAWRCEITANDGRLASPAGVAEAKVGNTPPRAPRLALVPVEPTAGSELRCELVEAATDPDGDPVSYAFAWFRNGERQPFAETSAGVPGRMVKAGDRWRCAATAADAGGQGGQAQSLEVVVGQAQPTAGR